MKTFLRLFLGLTLGIAVLGCEKEAAVVETEPMTEQDMEAYEAEMESEPIER